MQKGLAKKNTHLHYFVEHIPWQQLFCFCEWQLTDNSMWAAKIFPLHCFSLKLITVRLHWQRNQRQDGVEGRLFLFHYIPTHHSLQHYGLVLIHFRLSKSSPAKHLSSKFNAVSVFLSKVNFQQLASAQELYSK